MRRNLFLLPPLLLLPLILDRVSEPEPTPGRPAPPVAAPISAVAEDPELEPILVPPRAASGPSEGAKEDKSRRLCVAKVARLLKKACREYLDRRFEPCSDDCGAILRAFPTYGVALSLRDFSDRGRYTQESNSELFVDTANTWIAQTSDDSEHPCLPDFDASLLPPAGSHLATVNMLSSQEIVEGEALEEDVAAILRKLDTMKIDLHFTDTKVEDIFAFIRDFSGLNILLDAEVRDAMDPQHTLNFAVRDCRLKDVLKLLLGQFGLDYTVTEDRVVLLTSPARAARSR